VLTAADHVPITLWTVHTGPSPRRRDGPCGTELDQIHRMVDRRVDGVILWPSFAQLFSEHVHEFSSRNLPVVTIDHELSPEFNADYVGSDEASGGQMVTEHLYAMGHRRFGHLAGPDVASWALARRTAFESAVARMPGASVITLEALPDPPTAVFAATDLYAKVIYKAASEMGVRIPEDVSIVGFSDDDFAVEMAPPLTTIRQPAYEIGRRAAEIVLGRSLGRIRDPNRHEELPVKMIVRESTCEPKLAGVTSQV
jgi:DNA-binding LacI/PurR family transcriptional regulator